MIHIGVVLEQLVRLDSAPLLPPPQGEGDREAVEGVCRQW